MNHPAIGFPHLAKLGFQATARLLSYFGPFGPFYGG